MNTRRLHRYTAIFLAVFLVLHLANHLTAFAGQEVHRAVQGTLRQLYRHPIVEPVLLVLFLAQIGLGLSLALKRRKLTLQTVSGLYLGTFILIHLGAVLLARWQGTETDLAFAAAGMHAPQPWPIIFGLYYGLAVLSLGIHLSAALARRFPVGARMAALSGYALAMLTVALLSGKIIALTIPPALIAQFPALGQ